jgi:quinol monooxygenase YgiN
LQNKWQAGYDKLAEHVFANEPGTLTYYFGIPLEHTANVSRTDKMLAFEAYRTREDLYDVHLKSPVMTGTFFPAVVGAMTTGLDLNHFGAVGGFFDKSGVKTECGLMHDIQIRCNDAASRQELLGALKLLCTLIEDSQAEGSEKAGQILTFIGFKSVDDDINARIYARYKDRDTWEAWMRSPEVKKFWEVVKPCVASMDARPYAPNGKGWLYK